MLISSGVQHELINRFNGRHTRLDIVEGTFKIYKIEIHKMLSPMKLYITYKGPAAAALSKDLAKNNGVKV